MVLCGKGMSERRRMHWEFQYFPKTSKSDNPYTDLWICRHIDRYTCQHVCRNRNYTYRDWKNATTEKESDKMKIICVSNIKGGVGKSSTAASLAAGMSDKGCRVLMVDSDPQINLTMCFLSEQPDGSPSLYHVYGEGRKIDDVRVVIREGLDLVIGDFALCNADMHFLKAGGLKILDKALQRIETAYDFVVIDTPPNLGILSMNAFIASDYIIVPMAADSFSLKGVRLLKQTLDEVAEETGRTLSVAGILSTK